MSTYEIVETLDVTYADSAARRDLKIKENRTHVNNKKAKKGEGEKRIYVGTAEEKLDNFFCSDKNINNNGRYDLHIESFYIQREDLRLYYEQIKDEFNKKASQPYFATQGQLKDIYRDYSAKLVDLKNKGVDKLEVEFEKKYDNQNRYYLVLKSKKNNRGNYNYIRDICLPRISRLIFIKVKDIVSDKHYIFIKPFYGNIIRDEENGIDFTAGVKHGKGRKKQSRYRYGVLNNYSSCVVTGIEDQKLLVACHIKEHSKCESEEEKYDSYNGFTMTPTIHLLFDLGYLSFNEKGEIMISAAFNKKDQENLNIDLSKKIEIYEESKKFLKWHNDNKFITINI